MEPDDRLAPRLAGLPTRVVFGREVPVAVSAHSRLLGLAWLDPARAGRGLLIPGCRSIHTFGMRFSLELFFLDRSGHIVRWEGQVGSGRVLFERRARSVLELVIGSEGERLGRPRPQGIDAARAGRDSEDRGL